MQLGRIDEESTSNVGSIAGGSAMNVVAERCSLVAEVRHRQRPRLANCHRSTRPGTPSDAGEAAWRQRDPDDDEKGQEAPQRGMNETMPTAIQSDQSVVCHGRLAPAKIAPGGALRIAR